MYCPHCGSPAVEDEHGNVYRTEVEDRLSTYDRDVTLRPGVIVERHLIDGDLQSSIGSLTSQNVYAGSRNSCYARQDIPIQSSRLYTLQC